MELNKLIKEKRKENRLTMKQLADLLDVSESTISRWESSDVNDMKHSHIVKLSKILHISPAKLMGWDEIADFDSSKNLVPMVGTVSAGTPILATQNIENYYEIDQQVGADFCLRVRGESMINAGIYDGDIAFVRLQPVVENGEIAVVIIDDTATLKRYYQQDNKVILQPENSEYDPIIVSGGELRIAGKLVAVLHSFPESC